MSVFSSCSHSGYIFISYLFPSSVRGGEAKISIPPSLLVGAPFYSVIRRDASCEWKVVSEEELLEERLRERGGDSYEMSRCFLVTV